MNARLVITQETREKLNNQALSPIKKRELREQLIIESIRKAVGGTRTKQELIAAAGFDTRGTTASYAAGLGLISGMIRRGLITHNTTSTFKKNWTVLADVKTKPLVTPTPQAFAQEVVAPVEKTPELVVEEKPKVQVNKGTLMNLAKEFAWEKNSDSLREFIDFAKNRLK